MGIDGNEFVDNAANIIHDLVQEVSNVITPQDRRLDVRSCCASLKDIDWELQTDNNYYQIHNSTDYHELPSMSSKERMIINRVKAGHFWLTHEHLISRKLPPICTKCNDFLTMAHIFPP